MNTLEVLLTLDFSHTLPLVSIFSLTVSACYFSFCKLIILIIIAILSNISGISAPPPPVTLHPLFLFTPSIPQPPSPPPPAHTHTHIHPAQLLKIRHHYFYFFQCCTNTFLSDKPTNRPKVVICFQTELRFSFFGLQLIVSYYF